MPESKLISDPRIGAEAEKSYNCLEHASRKFIIITL